MPTFKVNERGVVAGYLKNNLLKFFQSNEVEGLDGCKDVARFYERECNDDCIGCCAYILGRFAKGFHFISNEESQMQGSKLNGTDAAEAIHLKRDLYVYFSAENHEECARIAAMNGHVCMMDCLDCTIDVVLSVAAGFRRLVENSEARDA